MEVFAVNTTKDILWRGNRVLVGNTYHYRAEALETFDDIAVINALVAAERPMFSTAVNFIKARTWGPTGQGPAVSKMREVKQLTGAGTGASTANWYPEFCTMVYWPLGRYGIRNRPQYLRKWLHTGRNNGGFLLDGSRVSTGTTTEVRTYIDAITVLNVSGGLQEYELCTEDGEHLPTGQGEMYPYLEHHQIGR